MNKALQDTLDTLNKRFGEGTVMKLGDTASLNIEVVSTGSLSLDIALGGGLPKGRVVEIFGPESCIDGNTFIQYSVYSKDGVTLKNNKGGTIKRMKVKDVKKQWCSFQFKKRS